jgi:hypothetical protein
MPNKRIETAQWRAEAALHVVVLHARVKLQHPAVLKDLDRETLSSSRLGVIQASLVIVQLEEYGRCVGHIYWVVIQGLKEFLDIPLLGVMRGVNDILKVVI